MDEQIISEVINNYKILNIVGSGAIGKVYKAYSENAEDYRAIKLIQVGDEGLKDGWENEFRKANRLKDVENVVTYHGHGFIEIKNVNYLYIMWSYIESNSLKEMIDNQELTLTMLVDVIFCCLRVLHACVASGIIHADLHSGNILIAKESPLNMDPTYRKIWVTDFCYLTQFSKRDYLDDFTGLDRIIQDGLRSISKNHLDGESKKIYSYLKDVYSKYLLETNAVAGNYVRNPKRLSEMLQSEINNIGKKKTAFIGGVGDFLAAEHLGEYYDEWKALFVPKFIALTELLERNICVLTGLRGCGKTMLFRRLTTSFNLRIGDSGINGSDGFYGFYMNARNIPEAFPWLPDFVRDAARDQVVNHFNLTWSLEILIWLSERNRNISKGSDLTFLNRFFKKYFPSYFSSGSNLQSINYVIELVKDEIVSSRLQSKYEGSAWPLSSYGFLEEFVKEVKAYTPDIENKPFYFFLDDYSTPMVKASTQLILNPVIMRRSADVIFKISTESVESFVPKGLNGKVLEENADYRLIDCGTMTFTKSDKFNSDLLLSILQPRIERHSLLKERGLTLKKLLGKTQLNNEDMACLLKNGDGSSQIYQGFEVFCDIWSSDIREMINLLADMINKEDEANLQGENYPIIKDKTQQGVYVEAGGEFIKLLSAATNPEENNYDVDREHIYAGHLVEIVKAFQEVTSFEMKTKKSMNQGKTTIKKARRIEITSVDKDLPGSVRCYYTGLIRYGIFIRDNRGKSVRGKIVPRLILRGALIPYFKITFSKRDHVPMSWDEFIHFLDDPSDFVKYWKKKDSKQQMLGQIPISDFEVKEQIT